MKYFKVDPSRLSPRFEVNIENFTEATDRNVPFEQKDDSGKLSQFGICPSCLNPVQLIGLNREIKNSPHAKHAGKDIKGLPRWNYLRYVYCPYAKKKDRKKPQDDERLSELTEDIISLYDLMKSQFDRIVYLIQKDLGIKFSKAFLQKAIKQFVISNCIFYPWLTEVNLPYLFAYFGIHHQRLFNQKFLIDSELYNVLSLYPGVHFINTNSKAEDNYRILLNKDKQFVNLYFRFTNHNYRAEDGETLVEAMEFCVDDRDKGEVVYQKTIIFSELYFMNLINKKTNEGKRQDWILDIADKAMPPLNMTGSL